ncbi:MAG: hypothetical protein M3Y49_15650 [Actinomycetota bacterium]|nr:hypothetical protein [Actinomycetota bacterium]
MTKKEFVRSSLGNRHPAAPADTRAVESARSSTSAPDAPTAASSLETAGEAVPAAPRTSTKEKKRYPPPAGHRRFGFYLHAATYDDVKSAYVADRIRRGDEGPSTISAWLTEAIDTYNALSIENRHAITEELGNEQGRAGAAATRQFLIADYSIDEASRQVLAEAQAGLAARTRSRYLTDALRVGIERVRTQVGTLPPAPERVPNTFH